MESTEGESTGTGTGESGTAAAPGPDRVPLSVSAAATALGIKDRAVRKRISAGTLRAVRDGSRWLVYLDAAPLGASAGAGAVPPIGPRHQRDTLEEELAAAQRRLEELAGQVGYWQGRYQETQATLALLTAAKSDPPRHDSGPRGPQIPEAPARGWRRLWWIGLYGRQ